MNIIWEVFLHAQRNHKNVDDLIVKPGKVFSPYYELSLDCLNDESETNGEPLEINPLYRYPEVFEEWLNCEQIEEEEKNRIFNLIIHYFYEVEKYKYYSKEDFRVELLLNNIEQEKFGRNVKQNFSQLSKSEQKNFAKIVLKSYRMGLSAEMLNAAARRLFPRCYVYYEDKNKKVLLYPESKKDVKSQAKMELLRELFLPIGLKMDVFWKYHFGIVDVEETMVLDQIELD